MMKKLIAFAFSFCVLISALCASPQNQAVPDPVKARLLSQYSTVTAGQEFLVGVEFSVQDGFHTYWHNPGDSGAPTRFEWKTPDGVAVTFLELPTPERIEYGNTVIFGYEGKVLFLFKVQVDPGFDKPEMDLALSINGVVCREVCLPFFADLGENIKIGEKSVKTSFYPTLESAAQKLPVPADWDFVAGHNLQWRFVLQANNVPGALKGKPVFFFPRNRQQFVNSAHQEVVQTPDGFKVVLETFRRGKRLLGNFQGVLKVGDEAFVIDLPVEREIVN